MNGIATHMGSGEPSTLDYWVWFGRIIGWDGILPICVFLSSLCIAWLFPQNQTIQTLALLVIPVSAFFCRAYVGSRQINSNCCGPGFRSWQYVAFGFALLFFVALDFMLVLIEFIPKGRRQPPPEDVPIWAGMIAAYFASVTFAMYPGRRPDVPRSLP